MIQYGLSSHSLKGCSALRCCRAFASAHD
jgi:hypothetical protein